MTEGLEEPLDPRTELDSHANMVVLGKNCFVFDNVHGRTCEVAPYDPSMGTTKMVPVVDAALAYDCPYTHRSYLLIVRNALYVPTMTNNLIPPFIIREAGTQIKDTPKIHVTNPDESDHAITFPDQDLRIPLQLWGIFSFFHTRMPSSEEIAHSEPIFLTPDSDNWNPHSEHFAQNEDSMLDWEGYIAPQKRQKKHTLDLNTAVDMPVWENAVDDTVTAAFDATLDAEDYDADWYGDQFAKSLNDCLESSKFGISIGSVTSYIEDAPELFEPIFGHIDDFKSEIDAVQANRPGKVTPELLSKIWHIKEDLAKKTIIQTTQLYRQGADNDLSRQFSTNDRMLRYKRINSQFFTDTLFVTAKGKSTRGNTCAQLFVSDKGFVAIYPMASKRDYPKALHLFCKEIGEECSVLD